MSVIHCHSCADTKVTRQDSKKKWERRKKICRRPRRQAKLSRRPGCNGREESRWLGKVNVQMEEAATFIHKATQTHHNKHTHAIYKALSGPLMKKSIHTTTFCATLPLSTSTPCPCLTVQEQPQAGYTKMKQRRIKEIITFPSFLPCQYSFTIWKHRPHPLLNKRGAHLFFFFFSHGGSLAITRDLSTRGARAISKFIVHGSSPIVVQAGLLWPGVVGKALPPAVSVSLECMHFASVLCPPVHCMLALQRVSLALPPMFGTLQVAE